VKIQDYNTIWDVTKPADIETALSKRHGVGRNPFWLSHGNKRFPAINIMVNGELAYIHYLPKERHPGFASFGMMPNLRAGEETTFFPDDTEEPLEIMNEQVVGFSDAIKVAQEFAVSAAMPKSIRWFEF
jgi:hypothetical protein